MYRDGVVRETWMGNSSCLVPGCDTFFVVGRTSAVVFFRKKCCFVLIAAFGRNET